MFSNKNNKFIKKQNAGEPFPLNAAEMPLNLPPQNMDILPVQNVPPPIQNVPSLPQPMPPDQPESFSESYPNLDYLYDNITSQETHDNIKTYICAFTVNTELNTHFVKYIVEQNELFASLPFFQFTSAEVPQAQPLEQQMPQMPPPQQMLPPQQMPQQMFGGYKDDSKNEEEIDIIFKKKTIEFVKTMFQDPTEPTYIGYIPNVSESNAVFVFVKIQNPFVLNLKYIECIPNELVFLSKVYNLEVEQPIKNLFANNPWLYMNQNLASPFSGYLCRKNEQNQIINVKKEEISTTNLYDQYLINIDEIGSYYYFSFLPFDLQNTELYQRFALFPIEYDCILDNDNLEYYKQNMINFENSDSIYFKGDVLTDKKEGMQFFVLKTPLQFTKI